MHEDGCDNCGEIRELYHFDAEVTGNPDDGAALCDSCNTIAVVWDNDHFEPEATPEGVFHKEIRELLAEIDSADESNSGDSYHALAALRPHAAALLALPEESVAELVAAAQSMVGAASFGRELSGSVARDAQDEWDGEQNG